MKTKDFIKMLQKEDPTGEGYLRFPDGGIPSHVEVKEGYWDGAYNYVDEEGNWVKSIEGYKVDVCCLDIFGFVENLYDHYDPNCTLDFIKSKFKFKLDGYVIEENREQRKQIVYKQVEEAYERLRMQHVKLLENSLKQTIQREKLGWKFYQNKKADSNVSYTYYQWILIEPNGKKQSSSVHDTDAILHSGLFERLDNNQIEGYYEWVLKEKV